MEGAGLGRRSPNRAERPKSRVLTLFRGLDGVPQTGFIIHPGAATVRLARQALDEDQNLRLRLNPHSRGRPKLASFKPKPLEALPDTM